MNKQECIDYIKSKGGIKTTQGWNVPNHVHLSNLKLTEIPIKFNVVNGGFWCGNNRLVSLKNSPIIVKGNFCCDNNKLTSLKYYPKEIEGYFYCYNNNLTSLKYLPRILKYLDCDKGTFIGKDYYKLLLDEKVITPEEYLLKIL